MTFPTNGPQSAGYLAVPEPRGGPAVIVLQEWWGSTVISAKSATGQPEEAEQRVLALSIERIERDETDRLGTYDPDAASRSWRRTLQFLRGALT